MYEQHDTMSPSNLLFAPFLLLLAAVNADLVTLRPTDWNAVDIYSVDQSTGIIKDKGSFKAFAAIRSDDSN
jgi:hypothetical protein